MKRVPEHIIANARALRKGTQAERILWRILAPYRPRFTRQFPVGPYIVDIACRRAKLAVELDGSQHVDAVGYDAARSAYLEARGWTVMRFWNGKVIANPDGVAQAVIARAAECLGGAHPQPLPSREGRVRRSRSTTA